MNKRHPFVYLALATALACAAQSNDSTGGKTNWLDVCATATDCGDLEDAICAERLCTRACSSRQACEALGLGLTCAPSASVEEGICIRTTTSDGGLAPGAGFPDGEALFTGTLTLWCVDDGDGRASGDFRVQLVLGRDEDVLTGEVTGLPRGLRHIVSGTIASERILFEPWTIDWSVGEVTGLELSEVVLDEARLSAAVEGVLEGIVEGDISTSCMAAGELALARDKVGPAVYATPEETVVGFAPITLSFDEPVASDAVLQVLSADELLPVELTPSRAETRLWSTVTITPARAWPSGELALRVENVTDKGGNVTDATLTLAVPERHSATSNPSFEAAIEAGGPWFGCTSTPKIRYTDWALSPAATVDVLPSDGATLAECAGNGVLLQAYIEPPTGATRMLLDVGNIDYSIGKGREAIELVLICETEFGSWLPLDEATDQTVPKLWTYAIDLGPAVSDCWLRLSYEGGSYEDGQASGAAFVDNLRFE